MRTGQWDERSSYMGSELRERTLGVIGLGGIARATIDLLRGFGMKPPLAFDPFVEPAIADGWACGWLPLDELLRKADFVSHPLPA